jgi:insertion element IS1 protein InsB
MGIREVCPQGQSPQLKKNGHIHNGQQNHHCHDCDRQFVPCCEPYLISEAKRSLIERLLGERISLRGLCRAVGVTRKWLWGVLVQCCAAWPDPLHVHPGSCQHAVLLQRLAVAADAWASLVQKKANKQWVWIAMEAKTRQSIAFHVGERRHQRAAPLWAQMPHASRQHATFYTDQSVVSAQGIPAAHHRAISKLARQPHHSERVNNTLRPRVSRLVRAALSFAKKLANHIGAMKLFICHYNLTRAAA